ncbi:iron chelate uptake ABC transporter family permease subunit, partial [Escherichia coli]|uniref:iron chelate uptake ABC transporter family permease subunit n=1 Tax=Escherichia coli TaxID=562 RepID=UPI0011159F97
WRNVLVAATGWMDGVSLALSGSLGFIGLVIPHLLRLCGFTVHRVLLPGCPLAWASALQLAGIVARLAFAAAALPLGWLSAALVAPSPLCS